VHDDRGSVGIGVVGQAGPGQLDERVGTAAVKGVVELGDRIGTGLCSAMRVRAAARVAPASAGSWPESRTLDPSGLSRHRNDRSRSASLASVSAGGFDRRTIVSSSAADRPTASAATAASVSGVAKRITDRIWSADSRPLATASATAGSFSKAWAARTQSFAVRRASP